MSPPLNVATAPRWTRTMSVRGNLRWAAQERRDFLVGALQARYEKCEEGLKKETAKMDKLFKEILNCKTAYDKALNETLSMLKEDRDSLLMRHEGLRKNHLYLASKLTAEIVKLSTEVKTRDKVLLLDRPAR